MDNEYEEYNFRAKTKFNIAVLIEESSKDGRVILQDPRTPQKLLIYKVINRSDYTEINGRWIAVYECMTDHLEIETKTTLTFYVNEQDELNLMVSDDKSSQMFFNLTKQ